MNTLNSWHTAPYFQRKYEFKPFNIACHIAWEDREEEAELDFLYHLSCDQILEVAMSLSKRTQTSRM